MVSQSLKNYYKEHYSSLDSTYIPNGIETKIKKEPQLIDEMYGLKGQDYILFLARLVPEKGVHYLIKAYQQLDTNKKLVIAGGSSHSDNYVKQLKQLAKDNNQIIFTGFIENDLLDELFTNAYCYVLPSDVEGLPISLIEAMAYGQCSLVSDIKENLEEIETKGESFKKGNIDSLAEKLNYLLNNEEVVHQYQKEAESYIKDKYDWDQVAIETEGVYLSLMSH